MNNSLPIAPATTDFGRFTRLKSLGRRDEAAAYEKVAQEFEALFFQMMLSAARAGMPGDGVFRSQEMQLYHELFDQQAAMLIASRNDLGFGSAIARAMQGRAASVASEIGGVMRRLAGDPATERPPLAAAEAALGEDSIEDRIQTGIAFIRQILPHAERAAKRIGTQPEVLVAQAVLETGWGQHVIRQADGRSSHNIFGIKATPSWQGERARASTLEVRNGQPVRGAAEFRSYDSLEAAFDDYADIITGHARYEDAVRDGASGEHYVRGLQRAGYATDPHYADKIVDLLARVRMHVASLDAAGTQGPGRGADGLSEHHG